MPAETCKFSFKGVRFWRRNSASGDWEDKAGTYFNPHTRLVIWTPVFDRVRTFKDVPGIFISRDHSSHSMWALDRASDVCRQCDVAEALQVLHEQKEKYP